MLASDPRNQPTPTDVLYLFPAIQPPRDDPERIERVLVRRSLRKPGLVLKRMRRLVDVVASGRVDLAPMVTHRFTLDRIEEACELFSHQRDGVL
jgi:threonine dehydrogenase-like Zn-dependent dehydrogenase